MLYFIHTKKKKKCCDLCSWEEKI